MQSGTSSVAVILRAGGEVRSTDGLLYAVPDPLARHKFRN